MATQTHPHAAVIDRIGRGRVKTHYNLSDRSIQVWRRDGVPLIHHKSLALLALVNGESSAELAE